MNPQALWPVRFASQEFLQTHQISENPGWKSVSVHLIKHKQKCVPSGGPGQKIQNFLKRREGKKQERGAVRKYGEKKRGLPRIYPLTLGWFFLVGTPAMVFTLFSWEGPKLTICGSREDVKGSIVRNACLSQHRTLPHSRAFVRCLPPA